VVAGEASGDLLGSRVLAALRRYCPELAVEGIGGPLMQDQGLRSWGIGTAHLVSPSVWAWRRRRIHKIRRSVDLMLCLFPFETDIYRQHDIPASFVGHPLADEIPVGVDAADCRAQLGLPPTGPLLALLPGSRNSEVDLLAPLFLQAAQRLWQDDRTLSLVIPAASEALRLRLARLLQVYPQLPVTLLTGRSREVMAAADAVLLASGTATLEAALLQRPMVVAYRMAPLSWWLVSRLVTTPFVALPNILLGRELVPELLQEAATPQALAAALQPLLAAGGSQQLAAFAQLRGTLGRDFADGAAAALLELAHG
jgi:lipid-A-disaccharide synthase